MLNFRNWTDDKAEVRGSGGETVKKRKDRKRGDAGARNSRTVAKYCVAWFAVSWLRRVEK